MRLILSLLLSWLFFTPSTTLARIDDCEHAVAQQKINTCAEQNTDDLEFYLQTGVTVRAQYLVDSEGDQLEAEHAQWLKQRDKECTAAARAELGLTVDESVPTLYPQIYAECRIRMTNERIKTLGKRWGKSPGKQKIKPLPTILFAFDSYRLNSSEQVKLERLANRLHDNPTLRLRIEGHTDERNSDEYNLALGEKLAQAVKIYLIENGIAEKRLQTLSFGEERPVALDHSETAWQQNRRVEFSIVAQ